MFLDFTPSIALLKNCNDLELRIFIRKELDAVGLGEAVKNLRKLDVESEEYTAVEKQLDTYEEHSQADEKLR